MVEKNNSCTTPVSSFLASPSVNLIGYDILSFSQLREGGGGGVAGGFLDRTPESTARIVWLIPNLVTIKRTKF